MRTETLSFMRRMALRPSFACLWLLVLANTPLAEVARCALGDPPTLNDIVSTNLSIPFLANVGQIDQQVSFYARTLNGMAFVTTDGVIIYSFPSDEPEDGVALIFEEQLVGADVGPIRGESSAKTKVSYFKGSDPEKWLNRVPAYEQVSFGNVYPGVSLALRAYANNIEKVFEISPDASVDAIRLAVGGVDEAAVNEDGQLVLSKDTREASLTRPLAYQIVAADTVFVEVQYGVDGSEYYFEVGSYDRDRPLIIDPLIASTFLGGTQRESYYSKTPIALDAGGNIYVASSTMSADFPVTSGVYDNEFNGEKDVFVAQLDPGLTTVLAATFVGGSGGNSEVGEIALDAAGRVYVCGTTSAPDFPTTEGAYDRTLAGGNDAFVMCLNSDLSSLPASTFLGGADEIFGEHSYAIALGDSGEVFVAGYTDALDFPTTHGAYDETNLYGQDCFIARFNQGLSELVACTYLGGTGHSNQEDECIRGMQLAESGDVFVTGHTMSSDFPVGPGAFDITFNGYHDAFVACLNEDLSELNSSTFLGGSGHDKPSDLAIGPDGTLYVHTYRSADFAGRLSRPGSGNRRISS